MKKLLKTVLALTMACACIVSAYNNEVSAYVASGERTPLDHTNFTVTVSGTNEGTANRETLFDNNYTTFWTSQEVETVANDQAYLILDMSEIKLIDRIDISKRFYNSAGNVWLCTGNMNGFRVEVGKSLDDLQAVYEGSADGDINGAEGLQNNTYVTNGTTQVVFNTTEARYIKITATNTYHWQDFNINKFMTISDLKVFGPELKNVARSANNAKATAKAFYLDGNVAAKGGNETGQGSDRPMSMMLDGTKNNANYGEFGNDNIDDFAYAELDLGDVYLAQSIHMYRYWDDSRSYHNTIVVASDNEDFNNPVYLFNSNEIDKTDVDSLVVVPATADKNYNESSAGKKFSFDELTEIRYVRVYMHGTAAGGTTNHIVELEVNGYANDTADIVFGEMSSNLIKESKYTDHTGTTLATADTKNPVTKFVTPKVLSIKAQSEKTLDAEGNEIANVRFITSVPSGNLEKVKFKIEKINGDDVKTGIIDTNKAYGSIVADGLEITSASTVFENTASQYFVVAKLNKIPSSASAQTVRVTPYWLPIGCEDIEENYVEGEYREFTVSEFFSNAAQTFKGE